MVNIEIRLIIFFADKDGEALISQQKQDLELTGSNNELLIARSYGRRHWHPTPVLLPGKSHGRRNLVGCSPWVHKESDMTEQLSLGLLVQNEAGQRLTEFCQENALVIANTLFQKHKRRLYTWTSPDGQY